MLKTILKAECVIDKNFDFLQLGMENRFSIRWSRTLSPKK